MGRAGLCVLSVTFLACGGTASDDPDAAQADGRVPMPLDAAPDADYRDAGDPPVDDAGMLVFGPGMVLYEVHLAETGHSWANWAPLVNAQFDLAIDNGEMIVLVELRGLDDPSGQNDPDVDVAIFLGTDTDLDPSDNFSGGESFRVSADSLDPLGNPRALLPGGSVSDGHIQGSISGEIAFFLPTIGEVKIQDPVFSADLVPSSDNEAVAQLQNGRLSGHVIAQDLETIANPVPTTCLAVSMLDLVALPCLSFDGSQPDVDRDADGLESFSEDKDDLDGQIDLCRDGNGVTYASTPTVQCVLDPAFQDAFTAILEVAGVRAFLLPPL